MYPSQNALAYGKGQLHLMHAERENQDDFIVLMPVAKSKPERLSWAKKPNYGVYFVYNCPVHSPWPAAFELNLATCVTCVPSQTSALWVI